MKVIVCGVFDRALGAFGRPFFAAARGVAVRGFGDEVNNPQSEFSKHPSDYELWELATWDDQSGEFSMVKAKERICRAADLVKEAQ